MKKGIFLVFIFIFVFSLLGCGNTDNTRVNEVIELIDNIPAENEITLSIEGDILYVRDRYEVLTEEEKTKVTNYDKLEKAEKIIQSIRQKQDLLIEEIEMLIDELPTKNSISLRQEQDFIDIEDLLSQLSEEALEEISNLEEYKVKKEKYDQLVFEKEIKEKAKEIEELIDSLPSVSKIKIEDEQQVANVRKVYEELHEEAKQLVTNYYKLTEAEDIIKYLKEHDNFNPQAVLSCVSDVATSNTKDELIYQGDNYTVEWTSSNEQLYYFKDGFGQVSKVYQTHKKQTITVTANVKMNNGDELALTKEITVNPVLFKDMPNTPVATYFQSGALSNYTNYSERYKVEGTLFSEKTKEVLDIIYYAFATITANGDVGLTNLDIVDDLMALKEYDVRVIVCIAGVSTDASKNFDIVTSNDSKRARFVANIVNVVKKYNFDGVDIDWESTAECSVKATSMNKLMKELRAELNKNQDPNGSPYLLSAAIPATSWGTATDRFDLATLNKYVDYINMMSYDLNNPDKATHLSGFKKSSYDGGYGFSCQWGVDLFTSRGLDREKIIIGSAGYGKSYKVIGEGNNSKYPGLGATAKLTLIPDTPGAHASGTLFLNAVEAIIKTGKYDKYLEYNYSGELVGSYLYNPEEKIFVTYDSIEVVTAKYEYADSMKGMGIMCWAYTEDTSDNFINAIYDSMHK